MKLSTGKKIFILVFILLVGNGILAYSIYSSNSNRIESEYWIEHSEEVIHEVDELREIDNNLETSSQAFIITNNSIFAQPIYKAEQQILTVIQKLKLLTKDNALQQKRVDSLNTCMHGLLNFSFKTITVRNNGGLIQAVNFVSNHKSESYNTFIQQIINSFKNEENRLLIARRAYNNQSRLSFNYFLIVMFISVAGFTLFLIFVARRYLRQNTENEKRADELIIANDELFFQNDEKEKRAAELIIANKELSFQNTEKEKRAGELVVANVELFYQNSEKEKRASELATANTELFYQNEERIKIVKDLIDRNKDLEQFAYIISHNLRAQIANIIGASNTLFEPDLDEDEKKILYTGINKSILRLDDVVKDLNHILEVKSTINEKKEIVYFSNLIEDIKISIKSLTDKYDIEINYDFDEVNELYTLKPYLHSIFFNLISNSVKYRRQNIKSTIEVIGTRIKNNIMLTIKDNGMGINLAKKGDQVFGLYKRFHENIEGKGLGLFMVKTQVEALGGKISIKSHENIGTEFSIILQAK